MRDGVRRGRISAPRRGLGSDRALSGRRGGVQAAAATRACGESRMRRSGLLDQFGNEMPNAANRGMTRRSSDHLGGRDHRWHWSGGLRLEPLHRLSGVDGGGSVGACLEGEPSRSRPSGMLLDTDFNDPLRRRRISRLLAISLAKKTAFGHRFTRTRGGGHDARLCIDLASLLTPEGRLTPADSSSFGPNIPTDCGRRPTGKSRFTARSNSRSRCRSSRFFRMSTRRGPCSWSVRETALC